MMLSLAHKVNALLTDFLIEWDALPPLTKTTREEQAKILANLERKLRTFWSDIGDEFQKELDRRGVPASIIAQTQIVNDIINADVLREFQIILADATADTARIAREYISNVLTREGFGFSFSEFDEVALDRLRTKVFEASA